MASLVTNTVCDIMARRGFWVRVFLDDYVGVTTQSRVDEEVAQLRKLLAEFGLRENQSKFVAPAQDVDILGIRFQFGASVAGVAVGRSATLEATLRSMLLLRTVGGPELRKLAGVLVKFVNRGGKSDVFNKGTRRFMMAASDVSQFCPVLFLREYLAATAKGSTPTDPLLRHQDGNMVVRRHVVDLLKRVASEHGVDPDTIMGHSIRIGAATHLAEGGMSFQDIMMFGGWLTEAACMKYLRWTEARLRAMSDALALSSTPRAPSALLAMAMAADVVPIE
jgi:hypothetical protein